MSVITLSQLHLSSIADEPDTNSLSALMKLKIQEQNTSVVQITTNFFLYLSNLEYNNKKYCIRIIWDREGGIEIKLIFVGLSAIFQLSFQPLQV